MPIQEMPERFTQHSDEIVKDDSDVGVVRSCPQEYARERQSRLISERAIKEKNREIQKLQREKAALLKDQNNKKKFFDKRMLHPIVSIPPVAWAIATLLAVLIMIDRRTGWARRPVNGLKFKPDVGTDLWSSPSEVNAALSGDCAKFVRQTGAFIGDEVGCAKIPGGGWHVWLRAGGKIIDPCVQRGMGPVPGNVYLMGTYVPIPRERLAMPREEAPFLSDEAVAVDEYDTFELDEPPPWPTIEDDNEVSGYELVDADGEDTSDVGEVDSNGQDVAGLQSMVESWRAMLHDFMQYLRKAWRYREPTPTGDVGASPLAIEEIVEQFLQQLQQNGFTTPNNLPPNPMAKTQDSAKSNDVSGTASQVATGIQIAGAVGSLVAAAYGGPAAAAVVNGAATLAATEVAKLDADVRKTTSKPTRTHLHEAALAKAKRSTGEERKSAVAIAVVTSDKPSVNTVVRKRLRLPRLEEKQPEERARLEAALVTLGRLGYLERPEQPSSDDNGLNEQFSSEGAEVGLWSNIPEPACPGTCGSAR